MNSDRLHDLRVSYQALLYRIRQHFSDTWDGSMEVTLDPADVEQKRAELRAGMTAARERGRNVVGMIEKQPRD